MALKLVKRLFLIVTLVFAFQVNAQTVYTTKTGEKFHKETCHFLKYSKKEVLFEKAIQLGYQACRVCKPSQVINASKIQHTNSITPISKAETLTRKISASQCTGKTKAGKRCRRRTKNASGRCYQH